MINVIVKPSSSENSVIFDSDRDIYVVRVKEPADKNKANDKVLKLLKKKFGKECRIKRGNTSKKKLIEFIE